MIDKRIKRTKQELEEAIKNSTRWREVIQLFGLKYSGRGTQLIKKQAIKFGIDFSHFNQHKTYKNLYGLNRLQAYLENKIPTRSDNLKPLLFKHKLKEEKCEECNLTSWRNKTITLQLHHVDGNNSNNKIENLKILCPNCHSQTDNWCNKNK